MTSVIDEVLELEYGEPVYFLLHVHPELLGEIDMLFEKLFGVEGDLPQAFRCEVGHAVAGISGSPRLASFISTRAEAAPAQQSEGLRLLMEYARATARAEQVEPSTLDAIRAAGSSDADIVFVAQTAGFLAFLSRVLRTADLMRN